MFTSEPILIAVGRAEAGDDLCRGVAVLKGRPLGPVSTVVEALEILRVQSVSGAILQDFLSDGSASPVARWLIEHDVPFVLSANSDLRSELQPYRSSIRVCSGSAPVFLLIRELEEEMVNHRLRKGELGSRIARA